MNISDEAVEAALDAYDPTWALVPGDWDQYFRRRMRVALEAAAAHCSLEAAASHLMAGAWDEGWDARAWGEGRESPYRDSGAGE